MIGLETSAENLNHRWRSDLCTRIDMARLSEEQFIRIMQSFWVPHKSKSQYTGA